MRLTYRGPAEVIVDTLDGPRIVAAGDTVNVPDDTDLAAHPHWREAGEDDPEPTGRTAWTIPDHDPAAEAPRRTRRKA